MSQVKVFVTDGLTDRQTDRRTNEWVLSFNNQNCRPANWPIRLLEINMRYNNNIYWYAWKDLVTRKVPVLWNMKALSPMVQRLWQMLFRYVGQRSWGQKFWYEQKGHITRNVPVKYESPTCNGLKVMDKVKVFVRDRRTDEWDLMSPPFCKSGGQKGSYSTITFVGYVVHLSILHVVSV